MTDLVGRLDKPYEEDHTTEMCEGIARHELRIIYPDIYDFEMGFTEPERANRTLELIQSGKLDMSGRGNGYMPVKVWYIEAYSAKDDNKRIGWYVGIDSSGRSISLGNHDGERWVLNPHPIR
jgi:hypothetical protein